MAALQYEDGIVAAPALPAGLRVLLAEDHPVNQELVMMLLGEVGLQVDVVADGEAAVQRARESCYDLVLLDIHMPRLDGLSACRAIRQLPGWSQLPIVALTASAFETDREACLAAGMSDFIAKPLMAEVFYAVLKRWLADGGRQAA